MAARRSQEAKGGHARLVPRRERPPARPEPLLDPRRQPEPRRMDPRQAGAARQAGLVLAATGLSWIVANWAGSAWDWPGRVRALLDLFALAGFGFGLYLTWQAWRIGRAHKG